MLAKEERKEKALDFKSAKKKRRVLENGRQSRHNLKKKKKHGTRGNKGEQSKERRTTAQWNNRKKHKNESISKWVLQDSPTVRLAGRSTKEKKKTACLSFSRVLLENGLTPQLQGDSVSNKGFWGVCCRNTRGVTSFFPRKQMGWQKQLRTSNHHPRPSENEDMSLAHTHIAPAFLLY